MNVTAFLSSVSPSIEAESGPGDPQQQAIVWELNKQKEARGVWLWLLSSFALTSRRPVPLLQC